MIDIQVKRTFILVEVLCNAGCNLMSKDLATGLDSLHLAVSYNRTDIVRLLIQKYSANPNITSQDGRNALHICARNGNYGKKFKTLPVLLISIILFY